MFTNRISKIVVLIVIVAVALLTVSFTASPKVRQQYQDYALRHPGGITMSAASSASSNQGSDYYQRHHNESRGTRPVDTADFFLRHPELKVARPVDTSDYFFRHPAQ